MSKQEDSIMASNETSGSADENETHNGSDANDRLEGRNGNDDLHGQGGDDVLSGGPGNDVVDGGSGDDRILGNDGSGDDTYIGGVGNDTVDYSGATRALSVNLSTGFASGSDIGRDTLREIENIVGGDADDTLVGSAGNNSFIAGRGDDSDDGGSGDDFILYGTSMSNYTVIKSGNSYVVTDKTGSVGTDHLVNVERVQFADKTVNLGVQAKSATLSHSDLNSLEELYIAFFNRVPDADGLSYWIDQVNAGQGISRIAESFYAAGVQYSSLTGFSAGMSNDDFVNVVYKNVLGRTSGADAGGLTYWSGELASGRESHGSLVTTILGSAHTYKGDSTWGWVSDLLDNRISVAKTFAVDWGLNYNTPTESITQGMAIAAAVTPTSMAAAIALIGVLPADMSLG